MMEWVITLARSRYAPLLTLHLNHIFAIRKVYNNFPSFYSFLNKPPPKYSQSNSQSADGKRKY